MRVKHLKNNQARVIRIGEKAMFEFMCETFMENGAQYFDLLDTKSVTFKMTWDQNKNVFTCIIYNRKEDHEIDFEAIAKNVGLTTDTMFQPHRYENIEL